MIKIYNSSDVEIVGSYNYTYSGNHMGDRKLTVEVESATEIEFAIGDYADLDLTYQAEKFFLHAIPVGNRVHDSLMIKYTIVFWSRAYELKTIAFLDYVDGTESTDAYNRNTGEVFVHGTIVQLMDRIKANMGRAFADGWYGTWQYNIDSGVDQTVVKDISLTNQYCWDALQLVNSLYGLEYRIDFDDRIIKVGWDAVEVEYPSGTTFDFTFGKDLGLCEITRLENTDQLVTRVFAYGSTRNISPTYRTGEFGHGYAPRLMLPSAAPTSDGYLANTALEAVYGIREAFYINEDIFPSITTLDNTIKAIEVIVDRPDVDTSTPQYETVIITPKVIEKVWDTVLNEYIYLLTPAVTKQVLIPTADYDRFIVYIAGTLPDISDENIQSPVTAKISFTSGLLTGNDFEILAYEKHMTEINDVPVWNDGYGNEYYKVTLKKINNDDNYILPNATITPAIGDEFVFLDIYLPTSYEAAAETALYNDTVTWLAEHSGAPMAYAIKIPEEFVEKYLLIQYYLRESNSAKITDTILNVDGTYLIQAIAITWREENLLPTYDLTLSNKPIEGAIQRIESALKNANYVINANNAKTNTAINNIEKSAYIINTTILNNTGDINGDIVAPQTILPGALTVELKSANYILEAYLHVNYLGDANEAYGTSGILTHKDTDVVWGGTYDLDHQTWTIASPQSFTLDPAKYYWAYIKCDLSDGSAIWVMSETKLQAEEVEGYYMFEWGQINPVIDGVRFYENLEGHSPVTIAAGSDDYLGVTEDQVLSFKPDAVEALIDANVPIIIGGFKEEFLIEETTEVSFTQESSWAVLLFNEQVGNFKAIATITNKVGLTIVALQNMLGFDNSNGTPIEDDNTIVTDGTITLALSIDATSKILKATVANMPADAKRIHFCFERCILSSRPLDIVAEMEIPIGMSASMISVLGINADMSIPVGMEGDLVDGNLFITEWNMPTGDFTLPLRIGYNYDMTVDWGDGSPLSIVTTYDDIDATHTYTAGTYQIKIAGTCETFYINYDANIRDKLTKVIQWGNVGFTSLSQAFTGCANLTSIPNGEITGITSNCGFTATFQLCGITAVHEDLFKNATVVTNAFSSTFRSSALTSVPSNLFRYNTLIESFNSTFEDMDSLTTLPADLFKYNTAVTSFANLIRQSTGLITIPSGLFNYNTLVTTTAYAFISCTNLTTVPADLFDNLTSLDTTTGTFHSCNSITSEVPDLWDSHSVINYSLTYYNCTNALNYADIPADWK